MNERRPILLVQEPGNVAPLMKELDDSALGVLGNDTSERFDRRGPQQNLKGDKEISLARLTAISLLATATHPNLRLARSVQRNGMLGPTVSPTPEVGLMNVTRLLSQMNSTVYGNFARRVI